MKVHLPFHGTLSRVGSDPFVNFHEIFRAWESLSVPVRKPWLRKITEWVKI